jgi:hypothetical protein
MKGNINHWPIPDSYLLLFLVAVIFVCFPAVSFCQDFLFLRSGEEQKVIDRKVGIDKVEFIRYDNQGGPIYELNKNDILKIVYQNGTVDFFDEATRDAADKLKKEQIFYDKRD